MHLSDGLDAALAPQECSPSCNNTKIGSGSGSSLACWDTFCENPTIKIEIGGDDIFTMKALGASKPLPENSKHESTLRVTKTNLMS